MERRWMKGDFLGGAASFASLPMAQFKLARCHVGELCFKCAKPGHIEAHCKEAKAKEGRGRAPGVWGCTLTSTVLPHCTREDKLERERKERTWRDDRSRTSNREWFSPCS